MNIIFSNKTARLISTVFVPPSFTIIIFTFFAFYLETEIPKIIATLAVAYLLGFIAPIAMFFILRNKNKIVDSDASLKEERTLPFTIAVLFYVTGLFILIFYEVNIISTAFWFCYISNTLLTIIINRTWKISAHAMGAAGPLAAVTYVFGLPALLFSGVVILIGWARIKLKCHTIEQVIAGILVAFISTYVQIYLIINFI